MEAISCKQPAASQWDVMWSLIGLKFRKSVVMHTTVRSDVRQQTPKWCRRSKEPFDWICYVSVFFFPTPLLLVCPCAIFTAHSLCSREQHKASRNECHSETMWHRTINSTEQTAKVEARRNSCFFFLLCFVISFFCILQVYGLTGPLCDDENKEQRKKKTKANRTNKLMFFFASNTCSVNIRHALLSQPIVNYVPEPP